MFKISSRFKLLVLGSVLVGLSGMFLSKENISDADLYYRDTVGGETETLPAPFLDPPTPAKSQNYILWGSSTRHSNPGVYLYQLDDLTWAVDTQRDVNRGTVESAKDSSGKSTNYPGVISIFNKINLKESNYAPNEVFTLSDDSTRSISQMSSQYVKYIADNPNSVGTNYSIDTAYPEYPSYEEPYFNFQVKVGGIPDTPGSYKPMEKDDNGNTYPHKYGEVWGKPGVPKYSIGYAIGFDIVWWGRYEVAKKIDINAPSQMKPGTTGKIIPYVSTKEAGSTGYGTGVDVGYRPESTYQIVSGQGIITLSGQTITAVKQGSATIRVTWKSGVYTLTDTVTIQVTDSPTITPGPSSTPPPSTGPGQCTVPTQSEVRTSPADAMLANASGVLLADNRGNSQFDVSKGIPVKESLYANIFGKEYLYSYEFGNQTGSCTFKVKVTKTYDLSWSEYLQTGTTPVVKNKDGTTTGGDPIYDWVAQSDTQKVEKEYTIVKQYSYWTINKFESYKVDRATSTNYALPGGSVAVPVANYTPPTVKIIQVGDWTSHVDIPEVKDKVLDNGTLSGGQAGKPTVPDPDWSSEAQVQVKDIKVVNDSLSFGSITVMGSAWANSPASQPGTIPAANQINQNVLYKSGIVIPSDKANSTANATTGNLVYSDLKSLTSQPDKTFPVPGVNPVTIHTPVVNYSVIPDSDKTFDQSVSPDRSKITFVLGGDQTVTFTEAGQHRNIAGYGSRSYADYVGTKRIRFPFGVYVGSTFYAANSWITLGVGTSSLSITIPEWVTEGTYVARTESWAVNAPSTAANLSEHNANLDISHYGAYEEFPIKVVGRVFGFRVYDIGDLRFETVFRTAKGSKTWTGFQYFSGSKGKDGEALASTVTPKNSLPIRPGSHPTQAATTPHNGYPILFYFNTIGNVWNVGEGVKITPEFYFVPKKGGTAAIPVNLYYNTTKAKMVKVGSALDRSLFTRTMIMGDPLRNVSTDFLESSGTYEYNHFWTAAAKTATPLSKFLQQLPSRKSTIGKGYKEVILNYQTRTLVGSVNSSISVAEDTQRRAEQRWFGEYNLPIAPYILPASINLEELTRTKYGGKISGKESEFLTGGYIIVNFKISTYKNNDPSVDILSYDASGSSNANMWKIENQLMSTTTYLGAKFDYRYGDIIMFESDFSVRDDYTGAGS